MPAPLSPPRATCSFADSGAIDLTAVRHLVLGEADLMLDMGFKPRLTRLLKNI